LYTDLLDPAGGEAGGGYECGWALGSCGGVRGLGIAAVGGVEVYDRGLLRQKMRKLGSFNW